jgi:methanogenic corrinoid protein MtbC1
MEAQGGFRELPSRGESGETGSEVSGVAWPTPPDLMQRSGTPHYDIQELVRIVGVPANILWGWEQSLGVPRPIPVSDYNGGQVPRYSERDVVAVLWLRDQIRAGMPPVEASHRLVAAQGIRTGSSDGWRAATSGPLSGPVSVPQRGPTSGPFTHRSTSGAFIPGTPSLRGTSGPSGPLGVSRAGQSGTFLAGDTTRLSAAQAEYGAMRGLPPNTSNPGSFPRPTIAGRTSGPLRAGPSGTFGPAASMSGSNWPVVDAAPGRGRATQSLSGTNGLRILQGALLRAIASLDVQECRNVLDDALRDFAPETTCLRVIQPVIERVGQMAATGQLTHVSERFAYITFRSRLAALLDSLVAPTEAPLILVACAPGEYHELGPMIVTVFWRRAGLRAVYLGANIGEEALVSECRSHRPVLVCLSAATDQGAKAINSIAGGLAKLDAPRPICGFGGAAFVRTPPLQARMHDSVYLGADALVATRHALQLIREGPLSPRG